MRKYIGAFFITLFMFLLQTTVLERVAIAGIIPNMMLIVTTLYGFMYGKKEGMFVGFLSGLLIDVLYNQVIGVSIILFCTIGYINGDARKLFFKEDFYVPVIVFGINDIIFNLMYYICYFLMRGRVGLFEYFFKIIIPEMSYTIIVGFFVYKLAILLDKKFRKRGKYPINISVFEEDSKKDIKNNNI
ncbi:MAG: rod shape-determining protein MreD [Lachnospiraceae bacterium]|nr:rod shape-determining protein MreD [Lachnospiraceae bacterium]